MKESNQRTRNYQIDRCAPWRYRLATQIEIERIENPNTNI